MFLFFWYYKAKHQILMLWSQSFYCPVKFCCKNTGFNAFFYFHSMCSFSIVLHAPQVLSGFIKICCTKTLKESLSLVKEGNLYPSYHLRVGLQFFSKLYLWGFGLLQFGVFWFFWIFFCFGVGFSFFFLLVLFSWVFFFVCLFFCFFVTSFSLHYFPPSLFCSILVVTELLFLTLIPLA